MQYSSLLFNMLLIHLCVTDFYKILLIGCPQHVSSKYRETEHTVGGERETTVFPGISCFSPSESPRQETDLNLSESLCPVFKTRHFYWPQSDS